MSTYHQGDIRLNKEWWDCFSTEAGVTVRRVPGNDKPVREEAISGLFNREWDRYHLTLDAHNLPVKGLSASVTGSFWNGLGHGSSTAQATGDISYDWNKELRTSMGTDFALYRYDMPLEHLSTSNVPPDFWEYAVERDKVRTYYVRQRWRPTRWALLEAGYELEHSRTSRFHTIMATFRFSF
jgi:hypothetical protein